MKIKILFLIILLQTTFSKIISLEILNNTGLNLHDIELLKAPEIEQIGFINNLDAGQKTIISSKFNYPINHLIIKLKNNNQEQGITHINKQLGAPVMPTGQITLEMVNAIVDSGSPISNIQARYRGIV